MAWASDDAIPGPVRGGPPISPPSTTIPSALPLAGPRLWITDEPLLVNLAAIVVGIYGGIATGLLANFILLFQLVLFRPLQVLRAFFGHSSAWGHDFLGALKDAPWHFEYLALALVALLAARLLSPLSKLPFLHGLPRLEKERWRIVTAIMAFGLALYYPLLALSAFTHSFGAAQSGFLGILQHSPRWLWFLVPMLGGLAVGPLVRYVAPESGGHGVAEVIAAASSETETIPGKVALWKSVVAGLTIGSGGSCGREGPVVHIGAAVASELGGRLGLSRRSLRLLMASGASAGIAATFNAPIAGAVFALEIILRDFGVSSVAPVVLAAVTATATSQALLGSSEEVARLSYTMRTPLELGADAILGVLCGLGAIAYALTLRRGEAFFEGKVGPLQDYIRRIPVHFRPALGGLMIGLIGLAVPEALGNGYESMNVAMLGKFGFLAALIIFAAKLMATGCTLGSGFPGGSFFPAVFLGSMLGEAFGTVVHALAPSLTANAGAYAAVGMGALVSGATLAPLTGMLMIFELTANAQAVPPLMVACGLAAFTVNRVLGGSIYTRAQQRTKSGTAILAA